MIVLAWTTGGALIGLLIGIVGAWRGRVIAAAAVTRTGAVLVWLGDHTGLPLLRQHKGHHTPRYQRIHAALADTQQWPVVTP